MTQEFAPRQNLKQVQLAAVREILHATSAALPLHELMTLIANMAIIAFDALSAWVMLEDEGMLCTVAARGADAEALEGTACRLGQGTSGRAALAAEALLLSPQDLDPADPVLASVAGHNEPIVLVPVAADNTPLGLLGASVPPDSLNDLSFLVTLAAQIATIIETARLRNAVQTWRMRLDAVFEQINQPVLIYDAAGKLVLPNPAAESWLAHTPVRLGDTLAEVIRKSGLRTADGQTLDPIRCAGGRALRGEVVDNQELSFPLPDGTLRYVLASAVPLRSHGQIEGAVLVWRDINEQKLLETTLRESEERYRALVMASAQIVWRADADGRGNNANLALQEVTGLSAEDFQSEGWLLAVHPDDRARVAQTWHEVLQTKRSYENELRLRIHDGSYRCFQIRAVPLLDAQGEVREWVGTASDITEQKQAEQQRDETLALLDNLLMNAPVGFAFLDTDLRFRRINKRLADLNGRSVAAHIGHAGHELFPQLASRVEPLIRQVLETGEALTNCEMSGDTPNKPGHIRHTLANYFPVRSGEGQLLGAGITVIDITERKQVEEALRSSEERFRTVQEHSMDGLAVVRSVRNETGVIVDFVYDYLNPAAERLLGQAGDSICGRRMREVFPGVGTSGLFSRFQQVVETGQSQDFEQYYEADGITGWFRNMAVRMGDGLAISLSNITPRKRAEERLARLYQITAAFATATTPSEIAAQLIEQGLASMGADAGFVALVDVDSNTLNIVASSGYAAEVIARWRQFPISANLPAAGAARSGHALWLPNQAAFLEHYQRRGDDSDKNAWAAIPLLVDDRVLGVMGLSFTHERAAFDPADQNFILTLAWQCAQALDRARLYDQERRERLNAQEATRIRDAFLSVAAHELKTPLTSLLGQAQLLERRIEKGVAASERDRRSVTTIVAQSRRLSRMITTLLDISRLESGQLSITREPFDLCALARQVVEEIQPTLEQHTVSMELPKDMLIIPGDALRLEQVLQNLIQNAVKYSPQGGKVQVRITRDDARAFIAVRDEGIGIPQNALPQLFQRFYRADNTATYQISGIGVGLFVVREIVSLHGGEVTVESVEGQGSTFKVILPLAASGTSR